MFNNKGYKRYNAFTLAELMIVIMIIGVIASITIPGLLNDTNDSEFNTALKKAYSDLAGAIVLIQANNNGVVSVGDVSGSSSTTLRSDFCSVMTCTKTDTTQNLFGSTDYKFYKGGNSGWPASSSSPAAMLNNGNIIEFTSNSTCSGTPITTCGTIAVDINGTKGPNMFGKDTYQFWITRQATSNGDTAYSVIPFGSQGDGYSSSGNCVAGASSWNASNGCTAKRLLDPDHMP